MASKALQSVLRYFDRRHGELLVGGIPVSHLAAGHPTPFYVYDLSVAREKYRLLRQALPQEIEIHYAIKANPHPEVIRFFNRLGLGFDVASVGELQTAMQAGVAAESCGFAGPGKSLSELEAAVRSGVGSINAESERELELINEVSHRVGVRANVSLRINPAFELKSSGMRIGGGPQPFGIDQEELPRILTQIPKMTGIRFVGFHLFAGSQNLKASALMEFFGLSFELLKDLVKCCPQSPSMINLGGGFGIPYFASDDELDIGAVGARLADLLAAHRASFPSTQFVIESGRYLIGESGVYVSRVLYKKVSRGETFLVVDGGLHHHLAATGNFGQVIRRNYPIAPLLALGKPAEERVHIVGPLCTPLDTLGSAVEQAKVEEGDLIGVFASGAYGFTASPRGFLSHPELEEIVVGRDRDASAEFPLCTSNGFSLEGRRPPP